MSIPLPKTRKTKNVPQKANRGLHFEKFCNQWESDFSGLFAVDGNTPSGKSVFIKRMIKPNRDASGLAKSTRNLVQTIGGKSRTYVTVGPLVTGLGLPNPVENGFLWHHTAGVPYIAASSIKGMLRAWAQNWEGEEIKTIIRLFGGDDNAPNGSSIGNIIIFDALPVKNVELICEVITPHDDGWRIKDPLIANAPSDWKSPSPILFLAIKEGAKFQFAMAPRNGAEKADLDLAFDYLEGALEWIGAGAKTSVGFGRFEVFENPKSGVQETQTDEKTLTSDWLKNLAEGDEANYFGQRVKLRDLDHSEGKAGLFNVDKNKSLGRKQINKLTPWKGS